MLWQVEERGPGSEGALGPRADALTRSRPCRPLPAPVSLGRESGGQLRGWGGEGTSGHGSGFSGTGKPTERGVQGRWHRQPLYAEHVSGCPPPLPGPAHTPPALRVLGEAQMCSHFLKTSPTLAPVSPLGAGSESPGRPQARAWGGEERSAGPATLQDGKPEGWDSRPEQPPLSIIRVEHFISTSGSGECGGSWAPGQPPGEGPSGASREADAAFLSLQNEVVSGGVACPRGWVALLVPSSGALSRVGALLAGPLADTRRCLKAVGSLRPRNGGVVTSWIMMTYSPGGDRRGWD